jgi:signal transduction histidine kinase/CheY-like chemotaxis protein
MTLRTRCWVSLGVFAGLLLLLAAGLLVTARQVQRLNREENLAEAIEHIAGELSYVSTDYLLNREPQQRSRWEAKDAALTAALAALKPAEPERQARVAAIRASQQRLQVVFADVTAALERAGQDSAAGIDPAFLRVSWSRMEAQTQRVVFEADQLEGLFRAEADRWARGNILLVYALVGIFGLYLVALYVLTLRRTLTVITGLQAGTRALGAGNLDARIPVTSRDELDTLGDAFNQMAASLKQITASKADLEREIAARQQTETALRTSEAETRARADELATLMDTVPAVTFIAHDIECRRMTSSRAARELLRLPEGATSSLSASDGERPATFRVLREGRELAPDKLPVQQAAASGREVRDVTLTLVFDDGTSRDLLGNAVPLRDGSGTVRGAVGAFIDITERQRAAEERARLSAEVERRAAELEATISSMAIGLIVYDQAGKAVLLNTIGRTMLPPEPFPDKTEEQPHITPWESENGQPFPLEEMPVARALRGETTHNVVMGAPSPDQKLWIAASAAPIRTPDGKMLGAVASFVDITARKRVEVALQQSKDELEQRVQARTADLAQKASQLQALTAELTLAEQRERQRLAEVLHDGLQQLLVSAKIRLHLLPRADPSGVAGGCREVIGLLEEALSASRALTGELNPPILKTGGLVAGLEWLVRWTAEKHHLAVDLQVDPGAVPDREATTLLLFQSVRELLFNVVKHAQVQAAQVEVRQQDGSLQIIVCDRGVGFDPATLPATGIGGLGLSSIRQRLEFLGGGVSIVAAPGRGCRITLTAPLQSRASERPLVAEPAAGRSTRRPGRGGMIRILLVDDHVVVRQALAQLLDAEPDLEVIGEAANGEIGVDLTKQLQPDIVLMDINMPVLNGMEATQQIRAECPGVQVIGLSMFGATDQTATMQRAGAVAYVSKSAPAEELLTAIRVALAR